MLVVKSKREASGFSLVELMVGMLLGLMLIAGAVSVYLASKQSYVEVEQVAALSENARFAQQILGDSLRHVGFLGEATPSTIVIDSGLAAVAGDCTSPAEAGVYDLSRFGFAATADGSGNALGCITDAVPNTDVLVIKHALQQRFTDADNNGVIDTPNALQAGRTYVMTNHVGGLLFDGSSPPTITTGGEVPDGNAWEYQYEIFYVQDTNVPQLVRRVLTYDAGTSTMVFDTEPVVEGVERLRLLFGFDSDGEVPENNEVDTYLNVATVTASGNWDGVQSVEVYMLVRSATPDVQYTDAKSYQLGDLAIAAPNDNFRRLISFTSLSLRNLKLMIRGDA